MVDDRIQRKIDKLVINRSRPPSRRWADVVKQNFEVRGIQWWIEEKYEIRKDRSRWRGLVNSQTY